MRTVLHPEAEAELRAAALWYEDRRVGLGSEFITDLFALLERVATSPKSFPVWPGTRSSTEPIRKVVMSRFPYLVAFEAHQDFVLLLAVAHSKRRPLYWLRRAAR